VVEGDLTIEYRGDAIHLGEQVDAGAGETEAGAEPPAARHVAVYDGPR
jgi:hypothetical protein